MYAFNINAILFSTLLLLFFKLSASKNSTDIKDLLNELSWAIKLKLWNEMELENTTTTLLTTATPTTEVTQTTQPPYPRPAPPMNSRRVGMSPYIMPNEHYMPARRQEAAPPAETPEETNMRMKLFRLMYETIRDSDLKVKRAELIREHYVNSTTFQIGYLLGDVTDKYATITDIANTLKRFYQEWNSIEHINAYEQIANQAIEINHLIDMIRVMNKRDQQ